MEHTIQKLKSTFGICAKKVVSSMTMAVPKEE